MKYSAFIMVAFLLTASTACRKQKDENIPPPVSKLLSIKLNGNYLSAAQIDSAFAVWKAGGKEQRLAFRKSNDSLLIEMERFDEGIGELVFYIFSNRKYSNQYYGQWFSIISNVTLLKSAGVNYNGPASFYDAAWLPRVELKDAIGHEATIALRPDDAYFIIKKPQHELYKLTVDRGYWKTAGGIQLAGRDIWQCQLNCTGKINNDFFKSLPGRIGNKPWNHISIAILFEINDNGEGWVLSLEHEP